MTLLDDLKSKIKTYSQTTQSKFYEQKLDNALQYEDRFWNFMDNEISRTSLALLFMELGERLEELEEEICDIKRQLR